MLGEGLPSRDVARFSTDDCSEVVMASFACGACLRAADLVILGGDPARPTATSHCRHCGFVNRVELDDEQTHRLLTLPRGNTFVHVTPELR